MEKDKMTHCPQCPNHCPKTSLMCGRGRMFFSGETEEKRRQEKPIEQMSEDEQILHYLRKTGHMLHHNPNFASDAKIFAVLTQKEKTELKNALQKLHADWDKK